MKYIIFLLFAEFFLDPIFCQTRLFISPGVKFGYAFGENSGFIYGIELSVINHSDDKGKSIYGFVVAIDGFKDLKKYHIGIEYTINNHDGNFFNGLGFETGPTLVFNSENKSLGFSVTAYHGLFIHPYFSYHFVSKRRDIQEIGSYLKFPIMIKGKPISFGG